jgi:adenosyl cobinamide kinase/adenosyl cobinamide phosphate guanylyltransferase
MALKSKTAPSGDNGLTFKTRTATDVKKVMIYGNDGTGKSTFAETYCTKHQLNPVVIDIDDTNFTSLPIVELEFEDNNKRNWLKIRDTFKKVALSEDFDTIIVDGVTSLLEMLVSDANGLKAYKDRADRFNELLLILQRSRKNIIYIGQADMKVIYSEDHQSNKSVIKVNSIVNEKYRCYFGDKGEFKVETEKFRRVEPKEE